MTEIRTTSSTGGQKGVKEERYDLLPKEGLDAIARVFAFGATKYADHNWRKGYEWGKSYAALMRHLTSFWAGETHDPESGLPHLAHAGFHVLVLLTWLEQDGEGSRFDDRYLPDREDVAKVAEIILGVTDDDQQPVEYDAEAVADAILARGKPPMDGATDLTKDGVEADTDTPPGMVRDLSVDDLLDSRKRPPAIVMHTAPRGAVPPAVLSEALRHQAFHAPGYLKY